VPQQIRWVGEDGGYKQREFVGADLGNTRDVRLQRGSFTQLSRTAKASLAMQYAQTQILDPEELRSIITGNVGGDLGLQDDPHRQRVRRQVDRWGQGPPKNWQPAQPTMDPATGQMVPPPPDPVLGAIFAPIEADEEPKTALLRTFELGRAMASTRYSRWPAVWQQGLRVEYLRMRQAAGIVTAADQQRAQQQATQQQQAVATAQQEQATAAARQQQEAAARDHEIKSAGLVLESLKAGAAMKAKEPPASAPAAAGPATDPLAELTGALTAHRGEMGTLFDQLAERLQSTPTAVAAPAPGDIIVNSPPIEVNLTLVQPEGAKTIKVLSRKGGKIETARVEPEVLPDSDPPAGG
jgi:hypothetical protein